MALSIRATLLLAAAAFSATAHFAWIETEAKTLAAGQKTKVKICFGHEVGKPESAISLDGLEFWAIAPSGQKTALKATAAEKWLVADFTATEGGLHRFVMAQDRGVMSQTANGFKAGGRDAHPDAKKSMKMWRSAVTYAGAGAGSASGLGLPLEVVAQRKGATVEMTLMRAGKPLAGADVALNVPGKEEAETIGVTDASGKFRHQMAGSGPVLFLFTTASPAPAGANYDTENMSSVFVVQ
jgi:uncharacterized GH25 family protein